LKRQFLEHHVPDKSCKSELEQTDKQEWLGRSLANEKPSPGLTTSVEDPASCAFAATWRWRHFTRSAGY